MINKLDSEIIKFEEDTLTMLDELMDKRDGEWWSDFYANKEKPVPFFKNIPDENLVSYVDLGILKPCKVLDIGCGIGRNSIYLANRGFEVCGIDFSKGSIETAVENAKNESLNIDFLCESIFDFQCLPESFDFIYDSGCFHHIKPHRRQQYLNTISNLLKPNGYFAMACFNLKGGANVSDYDVYRDFSMHGGLGFSEFKLRTILEAYFKIVEFREMKEVSDEKIMGLPFLWTVLMRNK